MLEHPRLPGRHQTVTSWELCCQTLALRCTTSVSLRFESSQIFHPVSRCLNSCYHRLASEFASQLWMCSLFSVSRTLMKERIWINRVASGIVEPNFHLNSAAAKKLVAGLAPAGTQQYQPSRKGIGSQEDWPTDRKTTSTQTWSQPVSQATAI